MIRANRFARIAMRIARATKVPYRKRGIPQKWGALGFFPTERSFLFVVSFGIHCFFRRQVSALLSGDFQARLDARGALASLATRRLKLQYRAGVWRCPSSGPPDPMR